VLAVAATHRVTTSAGACPARQLAARPPRRAWQRYCAGAGAKGHRYCDWAWASPPPEDQIPLTRNEIAALFSTLIIEPARGTRHRLRWPTWRRRRQHRARTCHCQRQARQP